MPTSDIPTISARGGGDPPIDPRTGKPTDIWCGGTSLLADGRVLVTGGNLDKEPAHVSTGLNTVFTFDPWTESWDSHEPMRQGRWYPTQLLMPDARTTTPRSSRPAVTSRSWTSASTSRAARRSRRSTRNLLGAHRTRAGRRPATNRQLVPRARQVQRRPLDPGRPSAWSELTDLSRTRNWGTAVISPTGPC